MQQSEFWVMLKTDIALSATEYPGYRLPVTCIVELSADEIAYVWPKEPFFCSEDVAEAQDPNYAIDGDWLSDSGYYHSFEDFKRLNDFSEPYFYFISLGLYSSIREAREVVETLKASI